MDNSFATDKREKAVGILNFTMVFSIALYIVMSLLYTLNPHHFDGSWWWVMLLTTFLLISPFLMFTISTVCTIRSFLFVRAERRAVDIWIVILYSIGCASSGFLTVLTVIRHALQLFGEKYTDVNKFLYANLPIFGWICTICVVVAYTIELIKRKKSGNLNIGFGEILKKPILYVICGAIFISLLFVPCERRKMGVDGGDDLYIRYDALACCYVSVYDQETAVLVDRRLLIFSKNYYKLEDVAK